MPSFPLNMWENAFNIALKEIRSDWCKLALFESLGPLGNTLILIASLLILDKVSDLTIENSVKVAGTTGLGKTAIGFVLVAFCTSLPALSVSIFSAITGSIGVAIGNAIGSNISNICLILGICLVLVTVKKTQNVKFLAPMAKEEVGSLHFGLFVGSIIPLTLIYIGFASRYIGIILLVVFALYVYQLSRTRKVKDESSLGSERQKLGKYTALTLVFAAIVVTLSYLTLDSASYIAGWAGIKHEVIGSTVVAFGTSVPILLASTRAVRKGHLDLALGNIVGTCFIDTTCILGATLIVSPLRVDMTAFSNLVMFSVIANIFLWYFLSSETITWREGTVLLFMYFLFLTISFSGYKT